MSSVHSWSKVGECLLWLVSSAPARTRVRPATSLDIMAAIGGTTSFAALLTVMLVGFEYSLVMTGKDIAPCCAAAGFAAKAAVRGDASDSRNCNKINHAAWDNA